MSNSAQLYICMDRLETPIDSLPLSYQEPLSLEPLSILISSHKQSGKCFILARVETSIPCPDGSIESKYFYYNAHLLNRLLFRQYGDDHLFRLNLLNPLTGTDIIGVEYYAIDPQKYKRELTENNSSNSETKKMHSSRSFLDSNSDMDSLPSFCVSSSLQSDTSTGVYYYSFDYLQKQTQNENVPETKDTRKEKSDSHILMKNNHKAVMPSKHDYIQSTESSLFASNDPFAAGSLTKLSSQSNLSSYTSSESFESSQESIPTKPRNESDQKSQLFNASVKSLKFTSVIMNSPAYSSVAIASISKRSSTKLPSMTPSALSVTIDDWKSKIASYSHVADENRSILSHLRVRESTFSKNSKNADSNIMGMTASQYSVVGSSDESFDSVSFQTNNTSASVASNVIHDCRALFVGTDVDFLENPTLKVLFAANALDPKDAEIPDIPIEILQKEGIFVHEVQSQETVS